ncbi:Npun_F0296 family exosortase-dependent surface protein [Sandaracinobacteroides saxicola]|nr:PEPxxWA-CTERM sorting domain-containing protein [Sandaracinobacteroides saxicola]
MMMKSLMIGAVALLSTAGQAAVTVTYEAPGVVNTTAGFDFVGVETFDSRPTGGGTSFVTDFGTSGQSTLITGRYSNVDIRDANQYGGAGGVGRYAETFSGTGFELALSTSDPRGLTYFGYWLPALDGGNVLEFYKGGSKVFTFAPGDVRNAIGGNSAYFGNPSGPFAGWNRGEPYAFVNVYFKDGLTFDRIRFFESPMVGGYESDNHTVGFFNDITGSAVPEPATWAMMIIGFGLVGSAMRRQRLALA